MDDTILYIQIRSNADTLQLRQDLDKPEKCLGGGGGGADGIRCRQVPHPYRHREKKI